MALNVVEIIPPTHKRTSRRDLFYWAAVGGAGLAALTATAAANKLSPPVLNATFTSRDLDIPSDIPPFKDYSGRTSHTRWYRWENSISFGTEQLRIDREKPENPDDEPTFKAKFVLNIPDGQEEILHSVVINDNQTVTLPLYDLDEGKIGGIVGFFRRGSDIFYNNGFITDTYPSLPPPPTPTPLAF